MRGYFGAVGLLVLTAVVGLALVQRPESPHANRAVGAAARLISGSTRISKPAPLSIPASFEPNVGQAAPQAKFVSRGKGMAAILTNTGIELQAPSHGRGDHSANSARVRIALGRSNAEPLTWQGEERLASVSNYFRGSNPTLWRTAVPHFARVAAREVLPGLNVVVYNGDQGLEYDLNVAPEVDVAELRLEVSGADSVELNSDGNIVMRTAGRDFQMKKPASYQEMGGGRKAVDCRYLLADDGTIRFQLEPYDRNARMVIDPVLSVAYSTFLGGAGDDSANSLAMDSEGKLYVSGTTTLASFPESDTAVGSGGGAADYFIAKIDPTKTGLSSLVYLTFLGGSGNEAGGLIAVDSSGDVAITGVTDSMDFPVTDSSKRTAGANDVTLSELDPTGAKLIFSTLFGGSGAEALQDGGGIAIGKSGSIFITSDTTSTDLPTTAGALHGSFNSGVTDGFLAVFTPSSTAGATPALKYCSYLGFNAQVGVTGVALDSNGNAYLTGFTSDPGSSFIATSGFQSAYGGGDFDAFLMKINPVGNGGADLVYATLLGGGGADQAFAVAVDSGTPPTAYVTGTTESMNFPVNGTLAPFQSTLNQSINASNAFVSVVTQDPNTLATSLRYSTYLGGSGTDTGLALALSTSNVGPVIYVAGMTTSGDFPAFDNFQPFNGDQDAFLTKLVPGLGGEASLVYSTPLGGTAAAGVVALAQANGVLTDGAGHIYLAGSTTASDFPRAGSPQNGAQVACASCQESPPAADAFLISILETAGTSPSLDFKAASGARNLNFGAQNVGAQNVPPQPAVIFNSGDAALLISGISIQGPNAADFPAMSLQNCMGANLMPGQQCSFEMGFVPSLVGPEEAFVAVADNAPGSPQLLALVGVGSGPLASASPTAIDFGAVPIGGSPAMNVMLANTGNQNLTISQVQIGGADAPEFLLVHGGTCGSELSVPPGQSCFVTVQFTPNAARAFHGEVDFIDNSGSVPGTQQTVLLTGMGSNEAPPPNVNLSPTTFVFGSQAVNTTSAAQTVTLTNTGSGSLNVAGISLAGPDAGNFGIVKSGSNPCPVASGTVNAGANCTVSVDFVPQSGGVKNATLAFNDNASGSPQQVTLTGTGTVPSIQLSPNSLSFGGQSVGVASEPQNIMVTNTGNAPLGFGKPGVPPISFQGVNPTDFSETDTCGLSIGNTAPGNTCTIAVSFKPLGPGSRSATLAITDNAPGSPQTIMLGGTATQAGVSLSVASVTFPNEIGGTSSAAQMVTVTNTGNGALAIAQISLSGSNPAAFSEKDSCTGSKVTITPRGTCAIQVTFAPPSDGPASANLVLTDNAPDSPESVPLTGNGVDFTLGAASGAQTTATVTAGQTATYSLMVGGGAGSVPLTCAGAPTAGVCSVPATATAGSPFMVSVSTAARTGIAARRTPPTIELGLPRQIPWLAVLVLAAMAMIWGRRNRAPGTRLLQAIALAAFFALAVSACGGGGGGGSDPAIVTGTPAGTYMLNVTGSAGGTNHSIVLTLLVQ